MPHVYNTNTKEVLLSVDIVRFPEYTSGDWVVLNGDVPDCTPLHFAYNPETHMLEEMGPEEQAVVDEQQNRVTYKPANIITNEIYNSCPDEETKWRIITALNKYPVFYVMLNDPPTIVNYPLARQVMQMALSNGDIIQSDYDLIDAAIPNP